VKFIFRGGSLFSRSREATMWIRKSHHFGIFTRAGGGAERSAIRASNVSLLFRSRNTDQEPFVDPPSIPRRDPFWISKQIAPKTLDPQVRADCVAQTDRGPVSMSHLEVIQLDGVCIVPVRCLACQCSLDKALALLQLSIES
jgi:hypothetical protein